ncbi:MAG: hypothetical protein H0X65_19305 [Gemmatimonadetes bacterium]|nr:hypothetical protein [Gemmatimonadota bacterium]
MLLLATSLGCGGREPASAEAAMTRERFIETYVALRRIEGDTTAVDSLRPLVLAEHGATEEQLRNFVIERGEDPAELARIWEEIYRRLEEAELQDVLADTLDMDTLPVLDDDGTEREPWLLRRRERPTPEIQ